MDKKIIEFYEELELQIPKMIANRPDGVEPHELEAAAEKIYRDIHRGGKVSTKEMSNAFKQEIFPRIRRLSYGIKSGNYKKDRALIKEYRRVIRNYRIGIGVLIGGILVYAVLQYFGVI